DLAADDRLYLVLARDGSVRALDAVRVDERGRVWDRDPTWSSLLIGSTPDTARWYAAADEGVSFLDGRPARVRDLEVGDRMLAAVDPQERLFYIEAYRREVVPR